MENLVKNNYINQDRVDKPAVYFYFNGKLKYSKPMNQLDTSVQRICKDLANSGYKMLTANFNRYVYCNYQTRDTQIVEFKFFTGYVDQNGKKLFSEDTVYVEGHKCILLQHCDSPGYYVRYTLDPIKGFAYGRTVEVELTNQSDFSKITKVKDVLGLDE